MKRNILLFVFFMGLLSLTAQEYVDVSVGKSYSQQTFYTFSDDAVTSLQNADWDLAFTTGLTDAGILYNESAGISFTAAVPMLRVYQANTAEFTDVIDPEDLSDSLYNTEISWQDGAFNSLRDTSNVFDFGWGEYSDRAVRGTVVYVIKLRDDTWKKIFIESLSMGIYTIKYADLDGENEKTLTLDKADYRDDSPLALFSFETETTVAGPANWDVFFGRYIEEIDPGTGVVQYNVTGALTAEGVEVVEIFGDDPDDVDHTEYLDSFKISHTNVIGQDWKNFDLGAGGWVIDEYRTYLVKLADGHLWKMVMVDFEGSSTGIITFEKTDLGNIDAVNDPNSNFTEIGIYPNPNTGQFTFSFSLKNSVENLQTSLVNGLGEIVWSSSLEGRKGLNSYELNIPSLTSGIYQLVSGSGADFQSTNVKVVTK